MTGNVEYEVLIDNSWYQLEEDFFEAGSASAAKPGFGSSGSSGEEGDGEDNEVERVTEGKGRMT